MDLRIVFFVCFLLSQSSWAQESLRFIVKYKSLSQSFIAPKYSLKNLSEAPKYQRLANGAYALVIENMPQRSIRNERTRILKQLRADPNVEYAVIDKVGYFTFPPSPESTTTKNLSKSLQREYQWNHFLRPAGIMLESQAGLQDGAFAYLLNVPKKPIIVAVLDTGITLNANLVNSYVKDENGRYWGWNFSANNNNLIDETRSYHGSHVAGIIAANGRIIKGVGAELKILPLKIPNSNGMFYESSVINAMYWAMGASVDGLPKNSYPAKVLNLSFAIDIAPEDELKNCDPALQEAVDYVRQQEAVVVASAGNDKNEKYFKAPAICDGVIRVAATGPEGLRSYFSNYGKNVTIAAPGGDKTYGKKGGILSTVNPGGGYHQSGFDFYQGTSMASPHVAAVAGLIFSVAHDAITAKQVEKLLITTTHAFGQSEDPNTSCGRTKSCGHGIVDAEYAIKATLARYDNVFSAPQTIDANMLEVQDENGLWTRQEEVFLLKPRKFLKNPVLTQEQDNTIIASYGSVHYKFKPSLYQFCEVIGFDGIGCYL